MTTNLPTVVLAIAKTVTAVFGTVLTMFAVRAFRRTGSPALRALAAGIGLVTLGAIAGGALHQLLGVSLAVAVAVQAVSTALGFGVLTYSLYAAEDRAATVTISDSSRSE